MNDHDTERDTHGRTIQVSAYGKDMLALEMAALDGAREFFGPDMRLEVIPDYRAVDRGPREPDRRFYAEVTVHEVTTS